MLATVLEVGGAPSVQVTGRTFAHHQRRMGRRVQTSMQLRLLVHMAFAISRG